MFGNGNALLVLNRTFSCNNVIASSLHDMWYRPVGRKHWTCRDLPVGAKTRETS